MLQSAREPPRRRRSLVEPSLDPVADEGSGDEALDEQTFGEGASLLAYDALERSAGTIDVVVDSPAPSPRRSRDATGEPQQAIRFKADVRIGGGIGRRRADGLTRAPIPILVRSGADESTPLLPSPTSVSRRPSLSFSSRLFGTSPKAPSDIQSRSSSPAPSLYAPLAASCEAAPSPERLLAFLADKSTGRRSSRLSTSESGYREAVSEAQAEHRCVVVLEPLADRAGDDNGASGSDAASPRSRSGGGASEHRSPRPRPSTTYQYCLLCRRARPTCASARRRGDGSSWDGGARSCVGFAGRSAVGGEMRMTTLCSCSALLYTLVHVATSDAPLQELSRSRVRPRSVCALPPP